MRAAAMLLLFSACGFEHGALGPSTGDDDARIDAPADDSGFMDAPFVPLDGQNCWSVAGVSVNVCLTGPLMDTRTFSSTTTNIDTNASSTQCAPLAGGSSNVCVIAADIIQIDATRTLTASGSRPLVLLANTIHVNGTIDVASHVRGRQGPASDQSGCNDGNDADGFAGGGGQGGSFGTKGGDGGNQEGTSSTRGTAGNPLTNVTTLRGGCEGGDGGRTSTSRGHGGGAVLLIATAIDVPSTGAINASGGSGEGVNQNDEGGGGAGSGGMIVFSASTLTINSSADIFANGGHGGGGSGNSHDGADGSDPTSATSGGGGGAGGDSAGDGAPGFPSSSSHNGQNGTNNSDGGGGGGGGAGIIRVYGTTAPTGSNISPAAT
ncbi:MAG TPA: hypothetical protein VL326_30920 [Kofleriaceae bacterium]|nr:hypothetical protein [Kofleriaceae bacterium]